MFHTTYIQIAYFDCLTGPHKGQFFEKIFKILLLRNCKEDEAETWHGCIGHCLLLLQNLCFLFWSDKNCGCYGNLKFP